MMKKLCIKCKHTEANHPFYDGVGKVKCEKFETEVTQMDMFRYGKLVMARELLDKFDKYSCIKNDKWYLEFKKELLETLKE